MNGSCTHRLSRVRSWCCSSYQQQNTSLPLSKRFLPNKLGDEKGVDVNAEGCAVELPKSEFPPIRLWLIGVVCPNELLLLLSVDEPKLNMMIDLFDSLFSERKKERNEIYNEQKEKEQLKR